MRVTLSIAVLLSVVATAMVAVCEHTEVCRLRYRLWEVERRRDSLERELRELDAALAQNETPASLLAYGPADEGDGAPSSYEAPTVAPAIAPPRARPPAPEAVRLPAGGAGRDLRWYEGGDR